MDDAAQRGLTSHVQGQSLATSGGDATAAVLVEPLEDRRRGLEQALVVADETHAADDDVEAARLGRVEALVAEVGLMDDPRQRPERVIGQLVAPEECLEGAIAVVVGQLNAADVESDRVGRNVVGVIDEDERRLSVDESANQPSACGAVDMAAGTRRPDAASLR